MDFEFENQIIALQQSNLLMVLNGKDTQVAYLTEISGGKIDFEFFGRGILATFQLMVVNVYRRVYYYRFFLNKTIVLKFELDDGIHVVPYVSLYLMMTKILFHKIFITLDVFNI